MAHQKVSVTDDWPLTPQMTAAGETSIMIVNDSNGNLFWVTTADDTRPADLLFADGAEQGARILHKRDHAMTLNAGERLWLRTPPGAAARDFLIIS